MEGTTVVVALLFVYMIFSSLGGGGAGPNIGFKDTSKVVASHELSQHCKNPPAASFSDSTEVDLDAKIRNFIQSYTKSRGGSQHASLIANSIIKYSKKYNVNPRLITALVARESGFNPNARSSVGAIGLGQLLPSTAASLGVEDSFDISQNIMGTTRYMKYLLDKWQGEDSQVALALASYLQGPNSVRRMDGVTQHSKGYINDIFDLSSQI